jgi:hypothetical protein
MTKTTPNWQRQVTLTRDDINQILDALSEDRDAYGAPPGDLEQRLWKQADEEESA